MAMRFCLECHSPFERIEAKAVQAYLNSEYDSTIFQSRAYFKEGEALLLIRFEFEGGRVDAISQAGRLGTIRKDMTEMSATMAAQNLHSSHSMTAVGKKQ
jgi:hypothetical protein